MGLGIRARIQAFIEKNKEQCKGKSFKEVASMFLLNPASSSVALGTKAASTIFDNYFDETVETAPSDNTRTEYFQQLRADRANRPSYVFGEKSAFGLDDKIDAYDSVSLGDYALNERARIVQRKIEEFGEALNNLSNPEERAKKQQEICQNLRNQYEQALRSYEHQRDVKDSLFEKSADFISHAWNNKFIQLTGNTSTIIEQKLETYLKNIEALEASVGTDDFETIFAQAFETQFSMENILLFEEKAQEYGNIIATASAADTVSENLHSMLDEINKLERQYSIPANNQGLVDYRPLIDAKQKFMSTIQQYMGITNIEAWEISKQCDENGVEPFKVYLELAKRLNAQAKEVKATVLDGKTVEEYEKELTELYKNAYGDDMNIVDRVAKYNRSQEVGGDVIKGACQVVIVTAATVISGGGATAVGVSTAVAIGGLDVVERATNGVENDLEKDDLLKIGKKALIGGAIAGATAGVIGKAVSSGIDELINIGGHKLNGMVASSLSKGTMEALVETTKEVANGDVSAQKIAVKAVVAFISNALTQGALKVAPAFKDSVKFAGKIEKKTLGDGTISWLKNTENYVLQMAQGNAEAMDWIQKNPQDFKVLILALADEQGVDITKLPEYNELIAQK